MKPRKRRKTDIEDVLVEIRSMHKELSQVSKFVKVNASAQVAKLIETVAFTPERKRIWVQCDGTRTRGEIEKDADVAHLTASDFLDECVRLGLVEEEKKKGGHPRRIIDYAPRDWEKMTKPLKEEPKTEASVTPQVSVNNES